MGASFTARFDSECADCGGLILEGDPAGYVDDEVCCEECWEADQEEPDDTAW